MSSLILPGSSLNLPFTEATIERAIRINGGKTPFHLYSMEAMHWAHDALMRAMNKQGLEFKNHFAVKALPNPHVMKELQDDGMGMDCSSITELLLCDHIGMSGENIMFTSNNTTEEEFEEALRRSAIINLDDITHIETLKRVGIPEVACCRYNPGNEKKGYDEDGDNAKKLWDTSEAKYGMRKDQIIEAYRKLKELGVQRFGLHAMLVSNERDPEKLIENAKILFELATIINQEVGIDFEWINLGGGIGVPYRPTDKDVDLDIFAEGVKRHYTIMMSNSNMKGPKIYMENGRFISGPAGALITRVKNIAEKHLTFVGVDASMQGLMRPGMYDAYHHITALGKGDYGETRYNITGGLCENNDQFARGRDLPNMAIDDLLAIHTTGAHGHAMGFNYNGKLRPAELLVHIDGSIQKIRREEVPKDLFATIL